MVDNLSVINDDLTNIVFIPEAKVNFRRFSLKEKHR